MIKIPQMLKWKAGRKIEPVFVSVVDLRSPTRKTPAGPAIAFMKSYGLDVALDNIGLVEQLGLDSVDLSVNDQEDAYLTPEEVRTEGYAALASANMNGLTSTRAIQVAKINPDILEKIYYSFLFFRTTFLIIQCSE